MISDGLRETRDFSNDSEPFDPLHESRKINVKDIEFEIPEGKGGDGKGGDGKGSDGKQPDDKNSEDNQSKEMVLGSGKDKWYHPNDEHDIGEAVATSRDADHSHLDDNVDLSNYDKVTINAHGTSDPRRTMSHRIPSK